MKLRPAADLPKNYRLVLDIIEESGHGRHLTMNDIYLAAARRQPGIGHSTVYRGIVRLRDLGLVSEVVLPGAESATYEPHAGPHAHFRCTACGRVDDVDYTLPKRLLRTLAERAGVEITGERLSFEGRCAGCRAVPA